MERLLAILRCDTFARCSKNVWLSSLTVIFVIMINYQAWVIPRLGVALIACIVVCYSLLSLLGYAYWIAGLWRTMDAGTRIAKSSYWILLAVINSLDMGFLGKATSLIFNRW
jgi:hypothetical protein